MGKGLADSLRHNEPGGAWTPVVSVYVYVYCIGASIRIRIPNIVSILHTAYVYGY